MRASIRLRRLLWVGRVKLKQGGMERKLCMCHEVLPLDRKRKKSFHSNNGKNVKATVRNLLSVPLKEINALNSS